MPSIDRRCEEASFPIFYSLDSLRKLEKYYALADKADIESKVSKDSWIRGTSYRSFLHEQCCMQNPQFDLGFLEDKLKTMRYKRALKSELQRNGVDFDDYRKGNVGSINTVSLARSYGINGQSKVYIHESDFHDFRLETFLQCCFPEVFLSQGKSIYCPQFYDERRDYVTMFSNFMNSVFLPKLKTELVREESQDCPLDTSFSYTQIFRKESYIHSHPKSVHFEDYK